MKLFQMLQFDTETVKRMRQGEIFTFKCECGKELPIGWDPKGLKKLGVQTVPPASAKSTQKPPKPKKAKRTYKAGGYKCDYCSEKQHRTILFPSPSLKARHMREHYVKGELQRPVNGQKVQA